jgi:hypothetical protein
MRCHRSITGQQLAGPYTSKMVSNAQLCVTVGIPSFLILVGIFVNLLTTSRLRADIRGGPVSIRSEIASPLPTLFGVVRPKCMPCELNCVANLHCCRLASPV